MSTPPAPVRLHPDYDPWERQPGESLARFNQFALYRDAGRTRTLRAVSEALGLNDRHVRATAAAGLWSVRAESFDKRRDALFEATWLDARRKAAENDAVVLNTFLNKIAARLMALDPGELEPAELIRALDVVLKQRRVLYPAQAPVTVTGPDGGPLTVQMAEFAQLTPDARRRAIAEMMAVVARRSEAAAGVDDDDDE